MRNLSFANVESIRMNGEGGTQVLVGCRLRRGCYSMSQMAVKTIVCRSDVFPVNNESRPVKRT